MGAIRHTQTATSDTAWDETDHEQRLGGRKRTPGQLGAAYGWVDTGGDASSKASYRYLHHLVDASSGSVGAASTRACLSGIAKLNGAGGVDTGIPEGDRPAVYEHLARHLTDAGMNAPKLRLVDPDVDFAPTMERRFTLFPVEMRVANDRPVIAGYAAVFDKTSHNLGGFVERVAPSFFNEARSMGWPDVLARFNHEDNMLLGTSSARTLRLKTDDTGLAYEIDPPKSRADVVELIERGDVRQSSFAFRAAKDEWTLSDEGYPLRILHSGQIMDIAPVTRAAYPDTTSAIRSLAEQMGADPEEIRHKAAADELRSLWIRSKGNKPAAKPNEPKRLFGPAAMMLLDERREGPGEG
jgi:Escherichia/Staphylococcus phage prohead protease